MLFSSFMQDQSQMDKRIAHSLLRHYIDLIVYTKHLHLDSLFNGNIFLKLLLNLRKLLQGCCLKALDKINHQNN